ncbi:MAG: outer membrane lipoprotein LolB [Gallionella sp.]|nr:outer membrane lipoprotein LolB [Gallionella sp.]
MVVRLLVLIGVIFLSGCASLRPHRVPIPPPTRLESAPFVLNGRISISYRGERNSAGLHWNHQTQSDEILLLTPLGQTVARISSNAQHATLDQGDQHHEAQDIETLMTQVLGWHLPLSGLHYWSLGKATMNSPAQIERDGQGRVAVLRQAGWEVRYLSYTEAASESLPARMELIHDDLQVKLFIDEWDWDSSSQ